MSGCPGEPGEIESRMYVRVHVHTYTHIHTYIVILLLGQLGQLGLKVKG